VIKPFFSGFAREASGVFGLQLDLQGGTNYTLEASSDLIRWTPLTTFRFDNTGQAHFTDPASTNFPARFYRFGQW